MVAYVTQPFLSFRGLRTTLKPFYGFELTVLGGLRCIVSVKTCSVFTRTQPENSDVDRFGYSPHYILHNSRSPVVLPLPAYHGSSRIRRCYCSDSSIQRCIQMVYWSFSTLCLRRNRCATSFGDSSPSRLVKYPRGDEHVSSA